MVATSIATIEKWPFSATVPVLDKPRQPSAEEAHPRTMSGTPIKSASSDIAIAADATAGGVDILAARVQLVGHITGSMLGDVAFSGPQAPLFSLVPLSS